MAATERERAAVQLERLMPPLRTGSWLRMSVFLGLVAALAYALHGPLVGRFSRPTRRSNGLILGILVAGIVYIFRQVMLLDPEVDWIFERFPNAWPTAT